MLLTHLQELLNFKCMSLPISETRPGNISEQTRIKFPHKILSEVTFSYSSIFPSNFIFRLSSLEAHYAKLPDLLFYSWSKDLACISYHSIEQRSETEVPVV